MKYLIILITLLTGFTSHQPSPHPSQINWDSTRNWKIYKLNKFNQVFNIPVDSLQYLSSRRLNDDTMHLMLSGSTNLGATSPLWMGCYMASCQTSTGKIQKIVISVYGGFFFSPADHTYYQIGADIQKDWLEYLSQSYGNIQQPN